MLLGNVVITKSMCIKYRLRGGGGRDSSPHSGLNPFQHELALAGWRGEDSRNGNGIGKHLEVSVDGTNWQGWRQEQNWPFLPAACCYLFYGAVS